MLERGPWLRMLLYDIAVVAAAVISLSALPSGAADLAVKLVSVTSPAAPFTDAKLEVKTAAEAMCGITVFYKSGPSRAKGLVPQQANARGRAAWTWRVGSNTTPGTWPIVVTCGKDGDQAELRTSFEVR